MTTITRKDFKENILTTQEACVVISRTRQQFQNYVKIGLIEPVKKCGNQSLYLMEEVLELKKYLGNYVTEHEERKEKVG